MAGGLTYLFTDVEGSTRLIQELGAVYGLALQTLRHHDANDLIVVGGFLGSDLHASNVARTLRL